MINLTDTQLVLLSAAAQRDDHVIPVQDKLNGAAASAFGKTMITRGWAEERPATPGQLIWRRDEAEQPIALTITQAGLLAAGFEGDAFSVDGANTSDADLFDVSDADRPDEIAIASTADNVESDTPDPESIAHQAPASDRTAKPRRATKQALVRSLLERDGGVSLQEITTAMGWLPHTVRAHLSGLRKTGVALARSKLDGTTRYQIAKEQDA